ncbi:hypothetical protein JTE90_002318 [Oedothorax gibbosus]|uniref:Uncharacterized protein n=1 Tax=Oedothorax gibbosus TaxID=931172 RepID=A0AAV6UMK3_9ARAC|nr:hypothetical protein JTE90_002318 [Oedothorax gibbosus]
MVQEQDIKYLITTKKILIAQPSHQRHSSSASKSRFIPRKPHTFRYPWKSTHHSRAQEQEIEYLVLVSTNNDFYQPSHKRSHQLQAVLRESSHLYENDKCMHSKALLSPEVLTAPSGMMVNEHIIAWYRDSACHKRASNRSVSSASNQHVSSYL